MVSSLPVTSTGRNAATSRIMGSTSVFTKLSRSSSVGCHSACFRRRCAALYAMKASSVLVYPTRFALRTVTSSMSSLLKASIHPR
jgi:hypothetical protein